MKFKHSLSVLIDNFAITYKQLLYRLVITILASCAFTAIITPFMHALTDSPDYAKLIEGAKQFLQYLTDGNAAQLGTVTEQIKAAFSALVSLVKTHTAIIAVGIIGLVVVYLVENFFLSLGNFATAAVINDKMALRAESPFFVTLIKNLKNATLYSLMYVPMSFVYDVIWGVALYFLVFKLIGMIKLIRLPILVFLYAAGMVFAIAVKMTMAADWMPSLIRGKMKQGKAFVYTFSRKKKRTLNVFSNFLVIVLLVFAVNVFGILFTFGVGGLITIPVSYVLMTCFQFVNYYDREELKYFIDKNTIIKPDKETVLTREQFFRGE